MDLDGCIRDKEVAENAIKLIDTVNSYTELSISGTGIHIIAKATMPEDWPNKYKMDSAGYKMLEIYDHNRYFTFTGRVYSDKAEIREIDLKSFSHLFKVNQVNFINGGLASYQDDVIINKIRQDKDAMKFHKLYDLGDLSEYEGDQSSADLALAGILAKWSNFEPGIIDGYFRKSKLLRPK